MWQERLSEFVTLFVVINPFAVTPVFIALTSTFDAATRRKIAAYAVGLSMAVLVFFIFVGGLLLHSIGVSLTAFQISGGIVLFLMAVAIVHGESSVPADTSPNPVALAAYPFAIPLIAGPASMLTVVLVADDSRFDILDQFATVGVVAAVLAIQYVLLLAAEPVSRAIGPAGTAIVGRIMGVLLAALAVNIVLAALATWLALPKL